MQYKISLINHLKVLDLLIITIVGIFAFGWYEACQKNLDDSLIDGLIVFTLISLLPVLYLHIEYYYYNRGTVLEIDMWNKKLIFTNRLGINKKYNFNDINKIVLYMPPHFHSNSLFIRVPFDTYHYAKIYLNGGEKIIITCLMVHKVKDLIENIRGVSISKKKRMFASILMG